MTPKEDDVFKAFTLPLQRIKLVLIGQDPYPQENVATGRCFEVGGLNCWHSKIRNSSLRNIVRGLYYAVHDEYLTYSQIKQKIKRADFKILPPNILFRNWHEQGVFMLNTALTTVIDSPSAHLKFWEPFTIKTLKYIIENNREVTFLLWGSHAKKTYYTAAGRLTEARAYYNNHPMICTPKNESDFLFGRINPFKATSDLINWTGLD